MKPVVRLYGASVKDDAEPGPRQRVPTTRLTELYARNFRSIEDVTVEFGPLTLLLGRNGTGKSNVLDALAFLSESLHSSLDQAMQKRGGFAAVRRRTGPNAKTHVTLGVKLSLLSGSAHYYLKLVGGGGGGSGGHADFEVGEERCEVFDAEGRSSAAFTVIGGEPPSWSEASPPPATVSGRLFLVAASGVAGFQEAYQALSRMRFHNLNPDAMREPQKPDLAERLAEDGGNFASLVNRVAAADPLVLERVAEAMRALEVPIADVKHRSLGSVQTVEVGLRPGVPPEELQAAKTKSGMIRLDAISLSDGTLRAMGIFLALFSARMSGGVAASLIGIEEPETALHPAALGTLLSILKEESERTQILLTCHSPDLLDGESLDTDAVRTVFLDERGVTVVAPIASEMADLVRRHLTTLGELLRQNQLLPAPTQVRTATRARNRYPLFASSGVSGA